MKYLKEAMKYLKKTYETSRKTMKYLNNNQLFLGLQSIIYRTPIKTLQDTNQISPGYQSNISRNNMKYKKMKNLRKTMKYLKRTMKYLNKTMKYI